MGGYELWRFLFVGWIRVSERRLDVRHKVSSE